MLLNIAEFRALRPDSAGLDDEATQLLLDAAESEIVRFAGALGSASEYLTDQGRIITLARKASAITSITETDRYTNHVDTLASDDYVLWPDGLVVERLAGGTTSRYNWHGRVAIAYTVANDEDLRKIVQSELVALMVDFSPGLQSETVGSWTQTLASNSVWNASAERAAILARLVEHGRMVIVG